MQALDQINYKPGVQAKNVWSSNPYATARKTLSMPVYAVNLADLSGIKQTRGPMCPPMLMLSDLLTDRIVKCEGNKVDGAALLLQAEPDRMTAVLDVLRNGAGRLPGIPKHQLRIYQASSPDANAWKRV